MNNDMTQYHKHGMSWVYFEESWYHHFFYTKSSNGASFQRDPWVFMDDVDFLEGFPKSWTHHDTRTNPSEDTEDFSAISGVFWIQPYSGVQKSSKFWHLRPFFKHRTQWLMIIIPIKWLFHWEYTLFSDKPIFLDFMSHRNPQGPGPGTSDPGAPRFQSPCWVCLCLPGCSVLVRTKGWNGFPILNKQQLRFFDP